MNAGGTNRRSMETHVSANIGASGAICGEESNSEDPDLVWPSSTKTCSGLTNLDVSPKYEPGATFLVDVRPRSAKFDAK